MKISMNELASLKDNHGNIQNEKVVEFLLPKSEGEGYHEWIAAHVRSYMVHIIRTLNWKPRYYNPSHNNVVLGNHVAWFFGVQPIQMLRGFPLIEEIWPTWESLFNIGAATKSIYWGVFRISINV